MKENQKMLCKIIFMQPVLEVPLIVVVAVVSLWGEMRSPVSFSCGAGSLTLDKEKKKHLLTCRCSSRGFS